MADELIPQSAKKPKQNPTGEISVERRMLLALVLMGAVLIGSQYLIKYLNPVQPETKENVEGKASPGESKPATGAEAPETTGADAAAAQSAPTPEAAKPAVSPAVSAAPGAPELIRAEAEQRFTIDTDVATVVFNNRGAVVESWTLKGYKSADGKPLELVNQASFAKVGKPFALSLRAQKAPVTPNDALYVAKLDEAGKAIDFEYAENGWVVRKSFQFQKDSFVVQFHSEVKNGASPVPHLVMWRGGFGDPSVDKRYDSQQVAIFDAPDGKLRTHKAGDASDGTLNLSGIYTFAGIEDKYFAAMLLPEASRSIETDVYSDSVPYNGDEEEQAYVGVAVGGAGENSFRLFRRPEEHRHPQERQRQARRPCRFRLVLLHRRAAFLCLELAHRQLPAQLWLVNCHPHHRHQLPDAAAQAHQHEEHEEDAGLAAADYGDQRQVQGHRPSRPA